MEAAAQAGRPLITLRDVSFAYRREPAIAGVNGSFAEGSVTAIIGPNGAGKSTLLKGLAGLLKPRTGSLTMSGIRRRDIAYLPQTTELDRNFPISVDDFVSFGTWSVTGMFGAISGRQLERVHQALETVGLSGLERRIIGTLSGGQLQRALFARMLLQDARLLLLDEPFAAIDSRTIADLMTLIHRWHGEGRTVITVLHDLDVVRENFPQSLLLAGRQIAWGPTDEVITPFNLQTARRLLEARDRNEPADSAWVA